MVAQNCEYTKKMYCILKIGESCGYVNYINEADTKK